VQREPRLIARVHDAITTTPHTPVCRQWFVHAAWRAHFQVVAITFDSFRRRR